MPEYRYPTARLTTEENIPFVLLFAAGFSILTAFKFDGLGLLWAFIWVPYILATMFAVWGMYVKHMAGYLTQALLGLGGLALILLDPSFPPTIIVVPVNVIMSPYSIYKFIRICMKPK